MSNKLKEVKVPVSTLGDTMPNLKTLVSKLQTASVSLDENLIEAETKFIKGKLFSQSCNKDLDPQLLGFLKRTIALEYHGKNSEILTSRDGHTVTTTDALEAKRADYIGRHDEKAWLFLQEVRILTTDYFGKKMKTWRDRAAYLTGLKEGTVETKKEKVRRSYLENCVHLLISDDHSGSLYRKTKTKVGDGDKLAFYSEVMQDAILKLSDSGFFDDNPNDI
jgi:hypothetical protein